VELAPQRIRRKTASANEYTAEKAYKAGLCALQVDITSCCLAVGDKKFMISSEQGTELYKELKDSFYRRFLVSFILGVLV